MPISTTQIQLTQDGDTIYTLHWGDHEDKVILGPYLGKSGIDFYSLSADYRRERYSEKEAAMEDYCMLSEDDFVDWLLEKEILQVVASTDIDVCLSSSCNDAYVPKHWPECPECGHGRGRMEYGTVRKSLNRLETFRRCTDCSFEWNFVDIANNSNKPTLDDDGRDTPGGCVPFSISKACGIDFGTVLTVCKKYGWNPANGMYSNHALVAARELGYELKWLGQFGTDSQKPPTLKQVIASLHEDRNYVIGVKNHWLAFVKGCVVDTDSAISLARRVIEIYEVRRTQAQAA